MPEENLKIYVYNPNCVTCWRERSEVRLWLVFHNRVLSLIEWLTRLSTCTPVVVRVNHCIAPGAVCNWISAKQISHIIIIIIYASVGDWTRFSVVGAMMIKAWSHNYFAITRVLSGVSSLIVFHFALSFCCWWPGLCRKGMWCRWLISSLSACSSASRLQSGRLCHATIIKVSLGQDDLMGGGGIFSFIYCFYLNF